MTVKTIIYTNIIHNIVNDLETSGIQKGAINTLLTDTRHAVLMTTDPVSLSVALDTFGHDIKALKSNAAAAAHHREPAEAIDHEISRNSPAAASHSDDRALDIYDRREVWQSKLKNAKEASHTLNSKASHHQEILIEGRAFSSMRPNKSPQQKIIAAFDTVMASRNIDQAGLLLHQER